MQSRPILIAFLSAITLAGCDRIAHESERAAVALGIEDEPPLPAETIDVLCDRSLGSPCTEGTLSQTLIAVGERAAARPTSTVRLWMLGSDVGSTGLIASVTSPPYVVRSDRAEHSARARWTHDARESLLRAARPVFRQPIPRRSPIAEGLSKVAMAGSGSKPHVIVVLTDGREFSSLGDFECGRLPAERALLTRLHQGEVLSCGSVAGMRVHLWGVGAESLGANRCPVTISRTVAIQKLWRSVLAAAGASEVEISAGIGTLGDKKER